MRKRIFSFMIAGLISCCAVAQIEVNSVKKSTSFTIADETTQATIVYDVADETVRMPAQSGAHRAAAGVAEEQNQFAVQMGRSVLNTSKLMVVQHIPGNADDEKISERRREDLLRYHAGIRTADHNRVRVLPIHRGVFTERRIPVGNIIPVSQDQSVD